MTEVLRMETARKFIHVEYSPQNSINFKCDETTEQEASRHRKEVDNPSNAQNNIYRYKKCNKLLMQSNCRPRTLHKKDTLSEFHITLHQAARDGDDRILKSFLDNLSPEAAHLKLNKLDENKLAPLHYAARYNHIQVVDLLLIRGADVNMKGDDGLTPLHCAARYGYSKHTKPLVCEITETTPSACSTVICMLVSKGALVNCKDDFGMTPLHYTAMRGNIIALKQLLNCPNINTEVYDKQEMTPLHCAANYNNGEVVEILLNAGAEPKVYDENNSTPLHLAATSGSKEIVALLLDTIMQHCGEDGLLEIIEEKNNSESTALHLAVDKGHLDVVVALLEKGANAKVYRDNFCQPLHLAAVSGCVGIVKSLLHHGALINCLNASRETPLHKAAAFNTVEIIDFLIENNAVIECRDNEHFTPLLIASSEGHTEAIKRLLQAGADIEVVDKMDRTVILLAVQGNHLQALKVLLEHTNASLLLNRCDRYDNSPLHVASLKGYKDIVQVLLDNQAEIEKKNEHEQTPLHLAAKYGHIGVAQFLLSQSKNIVNAEDENSDTPLHTAALAGHFQMVSLLLDSGANILSRNCHMWSALDCAASRGWKCTCRILLLAGSPVDPVGKSRITPLHLASREGHAEVVKLLLSWGANIAFCDRNGKNCLDHAIDKGHEDVAVEILSDKNWEEVLRNESDKNRFGIHQTPLRRLIRHMPDVAEFVFNRCVQRNEYHDEHPKLEISYNYEFLDDIFARYQHHFYSSEEIESISSSDSDSIFSDCEIYTKDGHIKNTVPTYTDNKEILKDNHPLMLMVTHDRQTLLNHPLCISLLEHKWQSYGRYVYYCNLLIFLLFLSFLTGYVVTALPPCPYEDISDPKCCWLNNSTCQPYIGECKAVGEQTFPEVCRTFIYVFSIVHLLKEIYQMYQNGVKYINLENFLEWACYLSALLFVADFSECSEQTGIREVWQWELGSLSIFSAWMVLVMFISKFPFLGIYVIMFLQILSTFANFSIVFFLFVVAFALGFYSLLQNQNPFETPGEAIIKTGVMMIGEMEFDAIFNDPENKVFFKGPSYLLFILFLLLMAVIIMNLLVGLAVDDIKGVQEQAQLTRLAMKVELVLTVERILPVMALRRCVIKLKTIHPNDWQNWPWILKSIRNGLAKSNTNGNKSSLEELEEQQTKLSKQLKEIQDGIKLMNRNAKQLKDLVENKLGISSSAS